LYYGYVIVFLSLLVAAVAWGSQRTFGVFLDPLIQVYHWSRAATSLTITIQSLVTGSMAILAGRLSDRFGPRIVLMICGILIGAGFVLSSFVSNLWQLYLLQGILVGAGLAGIMVPLMSMVIRWFTYRAGLMNGLVSSGQGLGTMIVPPVAAVLITQYQWQRAYEIIGIAALILIVGFTQFLKRHPETTETPSTGNTKPPIAIPGVKSVTFRESLKTRTFWLLGVLYFIDVFNVNVFMVHIVIHVKAVLLTNGGDALIAATAATTVLSAAAAVSILGRVGAGFLADRLGIRWTIGIGLGVVALAFVWVLFCTSLWMFYLFAAVFGLGGWCVGAVMSPLVAEYFGLHEHGSIFGAVTFIGVAGGAFGALIAGAIYDKMQSYNPAFILCSVLSVAGLIMLQFLRKPEVKTT
jgi:MFS family permease